MKTDILGGIIILIICILGLVILTYYFLKGRSYYPLFLIIISYLGIGFGIIAGLILLRGA